MPPAPTHSSPALIPTPAQQGQLKGHAATTCAVSQIKTIDRYVSNTECCLGGKKKTASQFFSYEHLGLKNVVGSH